MPVECHAFYAPPGYFVVTALHIALCVGVGIILGYLISKRNVI